MIIFYEYQTTLALKTLKIQKSDWDLVQTLTQTRGWSLSDSQDFYKTTEKEQQEVSQA